MERVAVIGGVRTPFVKAFGALAKYTFIDLGAHVLSAAVKRLALRPDEIDEFVFSTVLLDPRAPNFAREILFRTDLPRTISCHSVSNNCISGLVAVSFVAEAIRTGRISLGLAGGAESMSRPALAWHPRAEKFFMRMRRARSFGERLSALMQFRPGFMRPMPPSPKEPSTGLTMGEHCEMTAKEFSIGRAPQDELAVRSHARAAEAQRKGFLADEIEPLDGVASDNIIRPDTSIEKLAKLPAVFDRSASGTLSAGNSSTLTDGASVVALASERYARERNLKILGYIESIAFSAIDPKDGLLMGPAVALPRLLKRVGCGLEAIDIFEVHEAFAAQVIANLRAWENGWPKYAEAQALGAVPFERMNVNGGSLAIGHPFAATGGRLILSALNELNRSNRNQAAISICAAGAMAGAALLKRQ